MVPFFGLGRCGDKCRPEQKPEARRGFRTNRIESVDAVVCCRVGAGSSRHWLLWEALFLPFLSRAAVVSGGAAPSSLTLSELLTAGVGSVSERALRGDGVSCAPWNWSLSGSCLHL